MFGSPIGKPTKYVIGGSFETLAGAKQMAAKYKRKGVVEYRIDKIGSLYHYFFVPLKKITNDKGAQAA